MESSHGDAFCPSSVVLSPISRFETSHNNLSPDDALTIDCVLAAVRKRPCWSELLVDGNFKADLTVPERAERN